MGDTKETSRSPEPKTWLRLLVEEKTAAAGLGDPPPTSTDAPSGPPR
jgi:hypothetical protein